MDKRDIQLFDNQEIRSAWDVDTEQWYFSIIDVIRVLTDQPNQEAARNYWKSLKSRIKDESGQPGTKRTQLKMKAEDGKMRLTDVVNTKELLRLVQSIPSPKAEPFKQWLAEVGNERIDEAQNPEIAINRAMMHYRTLGYDENWINARLQSIQFRKELTDEWRRTGVKEGKEYALLTGIMMKGWSGKTVKEYKQFKGLKKENLRDNMTSLELALNILAETTATELSKTKNPDGLDGQKDIANRSGEIALDARNNIEKQTGHSVISQRNAKDLRIGGGNE
jgi:inositol-5-monophosphate dehydrogenase